MSQRVQRVVTLKTNAELAHDALHGIIYQSVPPLSRPPFVQSFMNEAEFKRFISRKLPCAKMPNLQGQYADEAIMNDELSKPDLSQWIIERAASIEAATRSHAARILNSQTHIAGNTMSVEKQSSLSHSSQLPRIAPFQSDSPPPPLIFQNRSIDKQVFSHIPACVAGNMPNLAECLIKWQQKVGGKATELLRIEYWSSRSLGMKPFFSIEQSHFGFRKIHKVEIDIPTIKKMPGLGGKWTFFYMTGKQWRQHPDMPE